MATITGTEGDDQFDDALFGTNQDDLYLGLGGVDFLIPSLGNDTLNGGADFDVAIYDAGPFSNGVFINNTDTAIGSVLAFSVNKGIAGTDTLIGIENFHGTNFDDTIYVGGEGGSYTFDRDGDDVVVASQDPRAFDGHSFLAGRGNDSYTGTLRGDDEVDYSTDEYVPFTQGVDVDLDSGMATDGWGGQDSLIGIERVEGTRLSDVIRGRSDARSRLEGHEGDDTLVGRSQAGARGDTLVGGAGNDTLIGGASDSDYVDFGRENGITQGVVVDLEAGTATDGFGDTDSLSGIEEVSGTGFDDIIRGNSKYNYLEGREGDDLLEGRGENDTFRGGAGNDTIDGGDGDQDQVQYHRDADNGGNLGVEVDLQAGTATDGFGDTDTLISIERVRGSQLDDVLRGRSDTRSTLRGEEGDDTLIGRSLAGSRGDNLGGGAGDDTIVGGASGEDYAEYGFDDDTTTGIVANLGTGVIADGTGGTDTISGVESLGGTEFNDVIIGDGENNFLDGREGDDRIEGGGGNDGLRGGQGNDILDGGDENQQNSGGDRVEYHRDHENGGTQGIDASLITGIAIDTFGDTDTLIDIEEIRGSIFDDNIIGGSGNDQLRGEGGNDTIIGNDGNDDLSGGDGDDTLDGGFGGDFLEPGLGTDIIIGGANGPLGEKDELSYVFDARSNEATGGINVTFTNETDGSVVDYGGDIDTFTGIERVRGTNNDDVFTGAVGNQTFKGFGGNDTFDGGAGDEDRIDYERAQPDLGAFQGIIVDMVAGTAIDAYGDTDTFINIEEIRGSNFDDRITGNGFKNNLQGEDGDDVIDSFGGENNYIEGGRGNDTLIARGDRDFANGGDGNDTISLLGIGGGANPGLGSDIISGGTDGFFSINYDGVGETVVIDTALGTTVLTGGDVDTFTNIRNVGGGDGDDILRGDDGADRQEFFTSLGNDTIDGRGGGRDWLIYDDRNEVSISVNFETGTAVGTFAGTDTFSNIEAVRGTNGADTFVGSAQEYTEFQGLDGVDSYVGGSGQDRLSFTFDDNRGGTGAITADLALQTATDGFGNVETFSGIEQVISSDYDDTLFGDSEANILIGLEGDDILDGRSGDDGLFAGFGIDTITGGSGSDRFGGRIGELNGDTITDFSVDDMITVFDNDFNVIAADLVIQDNQLLIDITGDGLADGTMTLANGYNGPINSEGGGLAGPVAAEIELANAGLFSATVFEGVGSVALTVLRTGDVFSTATADVTITGTGLNPADTNDIGSPFGVPQQITFLPGETSVTVDVSILQDLNVETAEDLAITLSNPNSDGAIPAVLGGSETYVRILNDDIPATVNITGEKAQESSGQLTFTVERTGDTSQDLDVNYTIRSAGGLLGAEANDLAEPLPGGGSVTISAGASTATFSLAIVDDALPELHDNVIASISASANWPAGLSVGIREAVGSIRNDDGVPPVLPVGANASTYGDPHIVTLDGLGYDFQAAGEFTLLEAVSGAPLQIQVRYQPVEGSDLASQTTAVATTLGTAKVMIDIANPSLLLVDGVAVDLADASGGISVGDGQIFYDGEAITLVYANGEQLRVDLFDSFLNASVFLAADRDVRGLLGNGDGDTSNDLALPDGTILPQPISFDDLYGVYADAWRISDATSLFDYAAGQGTGDFTDLNFPTATLSLDDIPSELLMIAAQATQDISDPILREAAILDFALTGDADTAVASVNTSTAPVSAAEVVDIPDIPGAIGVLASETSLVEGDTGVQGLVFTVYRTGDLSGEVSVEYSIGGTINSDDVVDISAGVLSFEAGQMAQIVELGIKGDLIVEDTEHVTVGISIESGNALIINGEATVSILDNDTAPALVALNGTSGRDRLRGTEADEVINGGDGSDTYFGRGGADTFVFEMNGVRERETIRDFETGVDSILLDDAYSVRFTSRYAAITTQEDGDSILVYGDAQTVEDLAILTTADQFVF